MMKFMKRTLNQIADRSCGNFEAAETRFLYRSSSALTRFFEDCDTEYTHDGSTRAYWVANVLEEILADPQESPTAPPPAFQRSEEHTSELQSLMRISYAVYCLKKKISISIVLTNS